LYQSKTAINTAIWFNNPFIKSGRILILRDSIIIKSNNMGNLLYIIAVVLIIGWALGFFVYSAGSIIHILLVIAVIAVLIQVIRGRNPLT